MGMTGQVDYEVKVVDTEGTTLAMFTASSLDKAMDYAYDWYDQQLRTLQDIRGTSTMLPDSLVADAMARLKGCQYLSRTVTITHSEWEEHA